MGLDSVELIIEFEKVFGIEIPDADAEKLTTVGSVYDYVYDRVQSDKTDRCITQSVYYTLRRYCSRSFEIAKQEFTPQTDLNSIFPFENRKDAYASFSESVELNTPALTLNQRLDSLLDKTGMITIAGGLIIALLLKAFFNYSSWLFVIPVIGIVVTLILSYLLNPYRIHIKPALAGDFTRQLVSLNFTSLSRKVKFNKQEIIDVINQVIVDKLGVDLEELAPEKSFTDDLGVD